MPKWLKVYLWIVGAVAYLNLKMPKWLKVCLWIVGAVVYLNLSYLFAYSIDSAATQTALSDFVYKIGDFMGQMGRVSPREFPNGVYYFVIYGVFGLLWPLILVISWLINFFALLMKVLIWLVAGGFWKWLGVLK